MHGGRNPTYARNAAVRAEVLAWGLDAPKVDPGETLLRLLSQSAARVARYGLLLAAAYTDAEAGAETFAGMPAGTRALIGHRYAATVHGDRVEIGEAIRGLVELEAAERDRCARFAKLALDAGIDERRVRVAERQAEVLEQVLRRALALAGFEGADAVRVIGFVPDALGELVGVPE